jgi:hypothetical protein
MLIFQIPSAAGRFGAPIAPEYVRACAPSPNYHRKPLHGPRFPSFFLPVQPATNTIAPNHDDFIQAKRRFFIFNAPRPHKKSRPRGF